MIDEQAREAIRRLADAVGIVAANIGLSDENRYVVSSILGSIPAPDHEPTPPTRHTFEGREWEESGEVRLPRKGEVFVANDGVTPHRAQFDAQTKAGERTILRPVEPEGGPLLEVEPEKAERLVRRRLQDWPEGSGAYTEWTVRGLLAALDHARAERDAARWGRAEWHDEQQRNNTAALLDLVHAVAEYTFGHARTVEGADGHPEDAACECALCAALEAWADAVTGGEA